MEKYYVIFYTKLKLEHEKPKHSNLKLFSKTKKHSKKGYACLIGIFENRNKANKVINDLGLFSCNSISSISFDDPYDQEIESDMKKDFIMIDLLNAQKLNNLIYKNWSNSPAGIKFKKDWSFLSSN